MTDIEERFADNGDDGSLIERQLLSGVSVKRESRRRPTKNPVANRTTAVWVVLHRPQSPARLRSHLEARYVDHRQLQL